MEREKSCGAVIFKNEDDRTLVLLVKHNIGHWSFPKGHMKSSELEEETAIREVNEEVGLDIVLDTGFRFVNTYNLQNGNVKDVIYFIGSPISDNIIKQEEEIEDASWYYVDDAYDIITYDNDKEVLRKAWDYFRRED